ncbi:ABC transporter permease [Shimia sediminis]|uniref:ABC transporter permease n=1 Tax=Shimia sediminis TaxID=2497945 RepID=UPI000F8C4C7A|nr:ABC transporter permease subunit [Shimia sediminis]
MDWTWVPQYAPKLLEGLWLTLQLTFLSIVFGMMLAIPLGLVQVTGPNWLARLAFGFCTLIRGTPLLIQLWLLYFGLGSLFPSVPVIRETWLWPILREAFPFALLAFTISVAGYSGEVMRGAFQNVSKGELEAARSFGMRPFKVLKRVWAPRAIQSVLPTLVGEFIMTLKATPLAATITVFEVYGVSNSIRQNTFLVYEPLLLVAGIYLVLVLILVTVFRYIENKMPQRALR